MSNTHQQWLDEAIQMANENAAAGGGPFAALVVRNGQIIGKGVNETHLTHDPTAHAELLAIREACTHLQTLDLSDCILYASGEPCPMCMGAIYWSTPKDVYFACPKTEAAERYQFDDPLKHFYNDMNLPMEKRQISIHQLNVERRGEPFEMWSRFANQIL